MRVRGRGRGTVARPRLWLCAALGLFAVMPAFAGGTAPETVLTAVEPDPTNDTTGDFQFSADIPGSTFECSVDASAFAACATPFHTAVLADGTHAFAVRAKEPGGVVDPSPATHSWRVDTVRPDTSITSGPSGTVNSSTAVFEFESPEAGVTFNCTRDGSAPFGCTSPTTFTNVADGAHTFTVRAIDGAGNVDLTPAARSWTVDAQGPETTIVDSPPAASPSTSAEFRFTSSESPELFECSVEGAAFASCTSPTTLAGLSDGPHAFAVRAVDAGGNPDQTPASFNWTVDTVLPDTTLLGGPSGPYNSQTAVFTFSSNEPGATFRCVMDSVETACASPKTYTELAVGFHLFSVTAVDAAGNRDATPPTRSFNIDLTAPNTTIESGPTGTVASTTAQFTFSASESGTFECSLDGGAFTACVNGQTYTNLAQGARLFAVRALDTAGNADASPAQRGWTVDTIAPETTFESTPDDPTTDPTGDFTFVANEVGSTFECSVDVGPYAACASPFTTPALGTGAHSLEVRARDTVGNLEATPATFTWNIVVDTLYSNGFED